MNHIVLFAFVAGVVVHYVALQLLKRWHIGQNVRKDGLQTHVIKKQGIPTMGGTAIVMTVVLAVLIFKLYKSRDVVFVLTSMISFMMIGFIDDWRKLRKKENEGLTSGQKLILQAMVGGALSIWGYKMGYSLHVPSYGTVQIGWMYPLLMTVMFVATTNATNLTDGADGLLTSTAFPMVVFFIGFPKWNYFCAPYVTNFNAVVAVAMLAFLIFNWHPAKMMMGDTGSLAIGGFIGAMAMVFQLPLYLILFGIIFVIEALSVMIQVHHYKRTKKRIFKMAPIHHHLELSGWSEEKICYVFAGVSAIMSALSMVLYRL